MSSEANAVLLTDRLCNRPRRAISYSVGFASSWSSTSTTSSDLVHTARSKAWLLFPAASLVAHRRLFYAPSRFCSISTGYMSFCSSPVESSPFPLTTHNQPFIKRSNAHPDLQPYDEVKVTGYDIQPTIPLVIPGHPSARPHNRVRLCPLARQVHGLGRSKTLVVLFLAFFAFFVKTCFDTDTSATEPALVSSPE